MSGPDARRPGESDPHDPFRWALYRAEDSALPAGGRRFRRFTELEDWVRDVLDDPWWSDTFPAAPVEVDVLRRSRSATFSAAHVVADRSEGVVWVRDGSWDAVTVVHELAHVAVPFAPGGKGGDHGPGFATALLLLWRRHLGWHAYGALRSALDENGIPYHRERLDGGPSTGR